MPRIQVVYRDVCTLLQAIRNILLGRKHTLHPRFPCGVAPRSIPPPDIPRGPSDKYSEQYYYHRHALDSVFPPVVAPVAMGSKAGMAKPESIKLPSMPTPGSPWWWDGHCYYECASSPPAPVPKKPVCPPVKEPPPPKPCNPCAPPATPPCPKTSEKKAKA